MSCPHYLAEILIYAAIATVTGGRTGPLLIGAWVVSAAGARECVTDSGGTVATLGKPPRALFLFGSGGSGRVAWEGEAGVGLKRACRTVQKANSRTPLAAAG